MKNTNNTFETKYFQGYEKSISLYKFLFRLKDLMRFIRKGKLLDHGCGYGHFMIFAKKYFDCTGTDISYHAIKKAKKINKDCKFVLLNSNENILPFLDEEFDVVASFDVIEHIKEGDQVIAEYARILKDRGILMIHTPTDWSEKIIPDETHINLYSEERVRKVLQDNSFMIRKFYYSRCLLYVQKLLTFLLRKKLKTADSPEHILRGYKKRCLLILIKSIIYKIDRLFSYPLKGPEFLIIAQKVSSGDKTKIVKNIRSNRKI